jgi:hypothetical protein
MLRFNLAAVEEALARRAAAERVTPPPPGRAETGAGR